RETRGSDVRLDASWVAEGLQDDVSELARLRLFGRELTVLEHERDECLVARELRERFASQQISSAVADLRDEQVVARNRAHGRRGAHAAELRLRPTERLDLALVSASTNPRATRSPDWPGSRSSPSRWSAAKAMLLATSPRRPIRSARRANPRRSSPRQGFSKPSANRSLVPRFPPAA